MLNAWSNPTGRRLILIVTLSLFLLSFGTVGYMMVGQFSFLDALYMTVITVTTVGYQEVRPLDAGGRLFTIIFIFMSIGFVAYNVAYFAQLLMDANWFALYRKRRVRNMLKQVQDHYIICGYGQMGKVIVDELLQHGVPVVVVEQDEALCVRLRERNIPHLRGDATEEEILLEAGIKRANGLVASVMRDTDNVFIVLTARDLNRNLYISARANTSGSDKRLTKAGADRVVSPYVTGAHRIAQNILRPNVTDFFDLALSGSGMALSLEELLVPEHAHIVGSTLMHSGIRNDFDLIIVAIKRTDQTMVYNPSPRETLHAGEILLALGPRPNLDRFAQALYGENYLQYRGAWNYRLRQPGFQSEGTSDNSEIETDNLKAG